MHWRVNAPKAITDSSGGAELMQLSYATKEVAALRLQLAELGLPLRAPTAVYVDATVALAGPLRDRVARKSRFLAARLAMVCQAIQDGQIEPTKVPGVGHRADGFTKPLTGAAFREFAAANLGLDTSDLIPTGQGRSGPPRQSAGGVGRNAASNGRPSATTGRGRADTGGSTAGRGSGASIGGGRASTGRGNAGHGGGASSRGSTRDDNAGRNSGARAGPGQASNAGRNSGARAGPGQASARRNRSNGGEHEGSLGPMSRNTGASGGAAERAEPERGNAGRRTRVSRAAPARAAIVVTGASTRRRPATEAVMPNAGA